MLIFHKNLNKNIDKKLELYFIVIFYLMKLFLLILIIISFEKNVLFSEGKRKTDAQIILEKLDEFIKKEKNTSKNYTENKNISKNASHLNQNLKFYDENVEYFLKNCQINTSQVVNTINKFNISNNGKKLQQLNNTLIFFQKIFGEILKKITIPPLYPHMFLSSIYPEFYVKFFVFFDFCRRAMTYEILDTKIKFKEVFLYIRWNKFNDYFKDSETIVQSCGYFHILRF